jgi:hypothetical protein
LGIGLEIAYAMQPTGFSDQNAVPGCIGCVVNIAAVFDARA